MMLTIWQAKTIYIELLKLVLPNHLNSSDRSGFLVFLGLPQFLDQEGLLDCFEYFTHSALGIFHP